MELKAIFTRRDPTSLRNIENIDNSVAVLPIEAVESKANDIDVVLLCGGSATDLPEQGPYFAKYFNTVDSYDNHSKIPEYLAAMDAAAHEENQTATKQTTAIIATGWDPGLFSMMRLLFEATLPDGLGYTFWGEGVSQGHSDAVRRVEGVKHAVQYTVPVSKAVEAVRSGQKPVFTTREKHKRDCFVVAEPEADKKKIEEAVKSMPHYFADFDTTVTFIEEDEFKKTHNKMPHGGMVLRSGNTGENSQIMEFSLKLESNPEFTGSLITTYARAAYRMSKEKLYGAKTVFDIPLSYLSEKPIDAIIKELL